MSIERRLAQLEEQFRIWHGSEEDEERARLVDERRARKELGVARGELYDRVDALEKK